jgi:hypothetical protein
LGARWLVDVLIRTDYNRPRAARLLGLTDAELRLRLEKHGFSGVI